MKYIDVTEFLMGRIKIEDLSPELMANMNTLIPRVNQLLGLFGEGRRVSSGYRSSEDQARINPKAPRSKHTICAAVDLEDKNNTLKQWCIKNLSQLEKVGLWMEDPKSTPTWVHLQCIAPRSGSRVFKP